MQTRSPFFLRWRRLPVLLGMLLPGLGVTAGRCQTPLPTDDEVRQILRQRIDVEQRGVGIVVGLIDEHGKSRFVSYGATAPGGPRVDERTLFEIGSVTKVFTALLLELAVERGTMKLDDPVAKYLPPEMKVPARNGRQITLLDLATQHSGLPRMPDNFHPRDPENPYADYTEDQLAQFLSGYTLTRDIGSRYEYSNLGFGLLGQAVVRAAGTDYETLVRRDICGPLGMTDTVITLPPALQARLAKPFDKGLMPAKNWDLPTLAGAGALRSDAADLLRFVAANLGFVENPGATAMEGTRKPRTDTGSPGTQIGLAWNITGQNGSSITWHNGATAGYHAFVGLDAARRGVVVLANSGNSVDDIARHLLDPRQPLTPAPKPRITIAIKPEVGAQYVGRYELAPDFILTVTRESDRYFAQATGQGKLEIFPETEADFYFKVVDAQLTFVKDASGKVTSLVLHQGGDQLAKRLP